ncbi:MAG: tRNA dihydrouridine synthase [Thermoplasmatota archaeon]
MATGIEPLRIGSVVADNNLILSPMAGFSDIAFRILCRRHGAGIVSSEQVSTSSLVRNARPTLRRARVHEEERPVMVQLVGASPEEASEAAAGLERADLVGFNMGCPAHQVKRTGCGAALLDHPEKASEILRAVKAAVRQPLVAKMRLGNCRPIDPVSFARTLEQAGADALIVHGRTAAQGYGGRADWRAIGAIVQSVGIPVIANGDVVDGPSAESAFRESGAAGLAIGRASLGDPRIFTRIRAYFEDDTDATPPHAERIEAARDDLRTYLELACGPNGADLPEVHVVRQAQRFTRAVPGGARLRSLLSSGEATPAQILDELARMGQTWAPSTESPDRPSLAADP